TPSILPAPR
nr:Chain E, Proteinase-activated receptor 4 [Homo sapiens]3QDZ_F Chain F, Proteinase-activated receptor 4 [Homo sapiens]